MREEEAHKTLWNRPFKHRIEHDLWCRKMLDSHDNLYGFGRSLIIHFNAISSGMLCLKGRRREDLLVSEFTFMLLVTSFLNINDTLISLSRLWERQEDD